MELHNLPNEIGFNFAVNAKIKDDEFAKIGLIKNDFHGEWNYIIMPNNK